MRQRIKHSLQDLQYPEYLPNELRKPELPRRPPSLICRGHVARSLPSHVRELAEISLLLPWMVTSNGGVPPTLISGQKKSTDGLPISWGGARGVNVGIYGSPMECLG